MFKPLERTATLKIILASHRSPNFARSPLQRTTYSMSKIDKAVNGLGLDSYDHQVSLYCTQKINLIIALQTSYVFAPHGSPETHSLRPKKRRKISKHRGAVEEASTYASQVQFPSLLNDLESSSCIDARHRLFEDSWGYTEAKIQV